MDYTKYFWICCFYFMCLSVFGQKGIVHARMLTDYDVLDTSYLRVAYSLEYVYNVERPADKSSDVIYVDIGKKTSKCYSYAAYSVDSLITARTLRGDMSAYRGADHALAQEVYKDNLLCQTKVVHRTPIVNESDFLYTDDYCNFNWEIHLERKKILNYSCQKATTTFRGRTWEAWFTEEIPVSDGPWKFCGLSGLILEVLDSQKHYVFSCTGVEKKETPIVMYKWDYQKTTREKLNTLLKNFHANYKRHLENKGVTHYVMKDGKFLPAPDDFSMPYNPVELE